MLVRRVLANDPANEIRRMNEMMERVFGQRFNGSEGALAEVPVDVYEKDNALLIRAVVPGVKPEELNVAIEEDVLTIRGEHRAESQSEHAQVHRQEISYGSFSRSLRLPNDLDLNAVSADFQNGVVTITLPRRENAKPSAIQIPVRSAITQRAETTAQSSSGASGQSQQVQQQPQQAHQRQTEDQRGGEAR